MFYCASYKICLIKKCPLETLSVLFVFCFSLFFFLSCKIQEPFFCLKSALLNNMLHIFQIFKHFFETSQVAFIAI